MFGYYLLLLFFGFIIQQLILIYKQFQAPPCEQSTPAAASSCYRPLFRPPPAVAARWAFAWGKEWNRSVHDENTLGPSADNSGHGGDFVDVHIFLTDEPDVKWHLKEGFEISKHWFSKSNISFGESFEVEKVPVPLKSYFPGVRLNITGPLEAHVFMVRRLPEDNAITENSDRVADAASTANDTANGTANGTANDTANGTAILEDPTTIPSWKRLLRFFESQEGQSASDPPVGGMLSSDIVHTSGPLTSLLPKSRRKVRRNLLTGRMHKVARNANTSDNSTGGGVNGTDETSDPEHPEAESTELTAEDRAEAEFERQLLGKYVQQTFGPCRLSFGSSSVAIPGLMYKVTVTDDIRAIDVRFFGSSGQAVPDDLESDYESGGGFDVAVYPDEFMMWLGTFFVGAGFLTPSVQLSALRFFAGPFTLLPLYYLKTLLVEEETRQIRLREADRQEHIRDLIREESEREDGDGTSTESSDSTSAKRPHLADVLSGTKTPPVPHLIPTLNLQLPLDGNEYAAVMFQKTKKGVVKPRPSPPPLVSFKMNMDKKTGQMDTEFIRYQVLPANMPGGRAEDTTNGGTAYYGPMLNVDQMSVMQRTYRPLEDDENTPDPRVTIRLETIPMWRYSVNSMMRNAIKTFEENSAMTQRDLEDVQELLFRHPIHLLIAMQLISWLSFLFSALAFKNEVGYFKGREDYRGLSSRTLSATTLHSVVILLYMWDFDDTSNMLMMQMSLSTFIEVWKYGRVARLGLYIEHKLPWILSMRNTSSEFVKEKIGLVKMAVLAPPGYQRCHRTKKLTALCAEPGANGERPKALVDNSPGETAEKDTGGQSADRAKPEKTSAERDEPQGEGMRRRHVAAASGGEPEELQEDGKDEAVGPQADLAETAGEASTVALVHEQRIAEQKWHAAAEATTDDIDKKGMFYLACFLYPLAVFWAGYNLYYYKYKSFWSWLISSMADFAYSFGFINMMPQVFMNYKLKTVAYMPLRVLIYKMFQTFIDDVVAFFILHEYMSEKHRWMTLRDDLVFGIYLCQWWMYGSDCERADEFGYVYKQAEQPANSSAKTGQGADAGVELKKSS